MTFPWPHIFFCVLLLFSDKEKIPENSGSQLENQYLQAKIENGRLSVRWKHLPSLRIEGASCGAKINGKWIDCTNYPSATISRDRVKDRLGEGERLTATYAGWKDKPELIWTIVLYENAPWITLRLDVENPAKLNSCTISGLRVVFASGGKSGNFLSLKKERFYRVLSETFVNTLGIDKTILFSSARPAISSVWLQLLEQPGDGATFLAACLEARRFITTIQTSLPPESSKDTSPSLPLKWMISQAESPPEADGNKEDFHIELQTGERCSSEMIFVGAHSSWSGLLDLYARSFQKWNQIEINPATPMVFCSWTAYYRSVTEKLMLKNAAFISQHLKKYGYNTVQVDGANWPAARGDYLHSNKNNFPHGMKWLGNRIQEIGLEFGVWMGLFEVSEHSSLYQHHKDWLLKDSSGEPVRGRDLPGDRGYILDMTHPGAGEFLKKECRTIRDEFGCEYFKLDFLESAVQTGKRFQENFTPLQAMREGLRLARQAVGPESFIVAGAAPAWAVAGLVDACRVGPDIAHEWGQIKLAADSIASRFYLHRRFFILDPDAMVVARKGRPAGVLGRRFQARPLTLEEARTWVTAAALTGGLLQLGDDLPELYQDPQRYALITNGNLIEINRRGKIAIPIDLMDFDSEDEIPHFWHIKEKDNSDILAIFNWQDEPRSFTFPLLRIGLSPEQEYLLYDIWQNNQKWGKVRGRLTTSPLPPHSVLLLRINPAT